MTKYTQKQLRELVNSGAVTDLTTASHETIEAVRKREKYLEKIGYCQGMYGCSGYLIKGYTYGKLYAVIGHVQNIYAI